MSVQRYSERAIWGKWQKQEPNFSFMRKLVEKIGLDRPELGIGQQVKEYDFVSFEGGYQEGPGRTQARELYEGKTTHRVTRVKNRLNLKREDLESENEKRHRLIEKKVVQFGKGMDRFWSDKLLGILKDNPKVYDGLPMFMDSEANAQSLKKRKGSFNHITLSIADADAQVKTTTPSYPSAEQTIWLLDKSTTHLQSIKNENGDYPNLDAVDFQVICPLTMVNKVAGATSGTDAAVGVANYLRNKGNDYSVTGLPQLNKDGSVDFFLIASGGDEPVQFTDNLTEIKDVTTEDDWYDDYKQNIQFNVFRGLTPLAWASILKVTVTA